MKGRTLWRLRRPPPKKLPLKRTPARPLHLAQTAFAFRHSTHRHFPAPAPDRQLLRPARTRRLQHRHQGLRLPALRPRSGNRRHLPPDPVSLGLRLLYRRLRSANLGRYGYGRNWMYFLQRATGVIAFFYIGYHIWNTSIQKYLVEWHGDPHPEPSSPMPPWRISSPTRPIRHPVHRHRRDRLPLHQRPVELLHPLGPDHQRPLTAPELLLLLGLFAVFTLIGLATLIHLHYDGLRGIATAVPAAVTLTR